MSVAIDVRHFTDPGCPWCYSAEPVRIALQARYADQLRWRDVQVGLHESAAEMEEDGYTTEGLAESYRVFHDRYGMPFCPHARPRLLSTWTAGRAVKAAEAQDPAAGAALLRRLRLAWFAEARLVDEADEISRLAAEAASLDLERFEKDFRGDWSSQALARDRAEAGDPDTVARALEKTSSRDGVQDGRYVTPSYVFWVDGRFASVPGFQPVEAYEIALHNLAPDLKRREGGDAEDFLDAHPHEPFAAVEVAAAIDRSQRYARARLEDLESNDRVVRTPAAEGELWSAGEPPPTLRCPAPTHLLARLDQVLAR